MKDEGNITNEWENKMADKTRWPTKQEAKEFENQEKDSPWAAEYKCKQLSRAPVLPLRQGKKMELTKVDFVKFTKVLLLSC